MKVKTNENNTLTSAAQAIFAMLQYTDKKELSLSEVMGYSTHAFRINIHPESVSPAGPTMFAPYELVSQSLRTLGVYTMSRSEPTPQSDKDLADTLLLIQSRIDTGVPVISWDLFAPEFGLIYGYDHEKQLLYVKDIEKDGKIKYSELNHRRFNHLFVCGFSESTPKSVPIMLRDALKRIINHAHGKSPYGSPEYKHGLAGYEAWIQAFLTRKIDVFGNAYNLAVVADAREHAYQFLFKLHAQWPLKTQFDSEVRHYLNKAMCIYKKVTDCFQPLLKMFPFPQGGEPNEIANSQNAIESLTQAYHFEKEGVTLLEKLFELLETYEDDSFMKPYRLKKSFQFAGEKHTCFYENLKDDVPSKMRELMKKDSAIVSRTINVRLTAYEALQSANQGQIGYIVARPVSFKPYDLPSSMKYYDVSHDYAFMRGKLLEIEKMYYILENWLIEHDHEHDKKALTIELVRPVPYFGADEEVEIYIPLVDC